MQMDRFHTGGTHSAMTYNKNIDIMKGISILFVVIIHSLKDDTLRSIGGPFFILQAVPVFLIISGYNHSQSYTRSGTVSLKAFYRPSMLMRKFYRLLPIALIIYAFQAIITPDGRSFFFYLIGRGGFGGYYISIMIQAIFLLPLLYWFSRKTAPLVMLGISFIFNLGYEYAFYVWEFPSYLYRLLVFRYLFALALGVWYFFDQNYSYTKKLTVVAAFFSACYLVGVHYFEWPVPFYSFGTSWRGQNPLSFFYALWLFHLGLTHFSSSSFNKIKEPLVFIGKRSYAIFIVQMIYFWLLSRHIEWPEYYFLLDLIVSCTLGTGIYYLDNRFISGKLKAYI